MTDTSILFAALVMGLAGGAHCVVMCGPVASVLCARGPEPSACGASAAAAPSPPAARVGGVAVAYNMGRVLAYAVLGLLAGAVGSAASGPALEAVRFGFRALAALCLLAVGLHLVGLPSFVRAVEGAAAPLWRRVAPLARRLLPLRSPGPALLAGALWALMPCGLLYAALALAASAGSAAGGAAVAAAFGLGTLPVMLGAATMGPYVTRVISARARQGWSRRAAGALLLAFGLWSTAGLATQARGGQDAHHGKEPHACCPRR